MKIQENVLLSNLTSFRIGGPLTRLIEIDKVEELEGVISKAKADGLPIWVVGDGSNVLASDNGYKACGIRLNLRDKTLLEKDEETVRVAIDAGESLDEAIAWTVRNGWWGMENLSFIPGRVGALVVQNVGAYGVKAEQFVEAVTVFDTTDSQVKTIKGNECNFGYRSSIFNTTEKGRYIILSIIVRLKKNGIPNISYPDVDNFFSERGIHMPNQAQMRKVITDIRKRKGQDWTRVWSAGSFFKNVLLTEDEYAKLRERVLKEFNEGRVAELDRLRDRFREGDRIKIPTGYLMDKLVNLRGLSVGSAALSDKQIINIINTGYATASDVLKLFQRVRAAVYQKLGVTLQPEPDFVGFTDEELNEAMSLEVRPVDENAASLPGGE